MPGIEPLCLCALQEPSGGTEEGSAEIGTLLLIFCCSAKVNFSGGKVGFADEEKWSFGSCADSFRFFTSSLGVTTKGAHPTVAAKAV